jgi:peroxiredoxin
MICLRAFRDNACELTSLGASVFGLSGQPLSEQLEFAGREDLSYPLLNDSEFRLSSELGLLTFETNGARFYRRVTFVVHAGRIVKVFYPVFPPRDNAVMCSLGCARLPLAESHLRVAQIHLRFPSNQGNLSCSAGYMPV